MTTPGRPRPTLGPPPPTPPSPSPVPRTLSTPPPARLGVPGSISPAVPEAPAADGEHRAPQTGGLDDLPDEPLSAVLDDLTTWLGEHVAFVSRDHHALTIALWAAHTYAIDSAASTPRLALESPEPESGKTRVLELLECVCSEAHLVLQISPAALFRWVEAHHPTILLDELDAVFGPKAAKDHEDLRALINSGHRRGATVPRVETPSMRVREYPCFAPVAVAGLAGCLPDTLRSRSIRVPMRRRAPDEVVRPFRERTTRPEGVKLGRRLAAWVSRHGDTIADAPELPEGVADRQADQWEPLLALADAAGGDWPGRARAACTAFVTEARASTDEQSTGVRLLADIREAFGGREQMSTADLIAALCAINESPWETILDPKPERSRAMWLAKQLKAFGPRPTNIGQANVRGYTAADFAEAWHRYLPDGGPRDGGGVSPVSRRVGGGVSETDGAGVGPDHGSPPDQGGRGGCIGRKSAASEVATSATYATSGQESGDEAEAMGAVLLAFPGAKRIA